MRKVFNLLIIVPLSTVMNEGDQPYPYKVSPVYSIDVHSDGVWCTTGTESGNINMYSVRHSEGKVNNDLLEFSCIERTYETCICNENNPQRKRLNHRIMG
jgi:hypothetical protein